MAKYEPQEGQQSDERFVAVVDNLDDLVEERVGPILRWFKQHANRARIPFQTTGGVIIALSVSIPLLAVAEGILKDRVLPIVALVIAALTGFNSFYQWQRAWQGRRQTQFALEHFLRKWALQMTAAKHTQDPDKAIGTAISATGEFFDHVREVTSSETEEYFRHIHLPRREDLARVQEE